MAGTLMKLHVDWYCPACGQETQTPAPKDESSFAGNFHRCPKMGGLQTPFVRRGVKAKIEQVKREDYVGTDLVRRDDQKRVVMAINVEREDGNDRIVFAPTAVGRIG